MSPLRRSRSDELNSLLPVENETAGTFECPRWKEHRSAIQPGGIDRRLNGSGVIRRRDIRAISANVDPRIRPLDGKISLDGEMSVDQVSAARGVAIRVRCLRLARHESGYR